jgi:hypothetical protein
VVFSEVGASLPFLKAGTVTKASLARLRQFIRSTLKKGDTVWTYPWEGPGGKTFSTLGILGPHQPLYEPVLTYSFGKKSRG